MKTLVYISISLLLLTSIIPACKSSETKPADIPAQQDSVVIEHPKPAGEQQTDSLKRMLDEKRKQRQTKP